MSDEQKRAEDMTLGEGLQAIADKLAARGLTLEDIGLSSHDHAATAYVEQAFSERGESGRIQGRPSPDPRVYVDSASELDVSGGRHDFQRFLPGSQEQVDAIAERVVEQLKPFIAEAFDEAIARAFADKQED